jgi:hypothetical protein
MYWYIAMHLLTTTRKLFFGNRFVGSRNTNTIQSIWELRKKLHNIVGVRNNKYKLDG